MTTERERVIATVHASIDAGVETTLNIMRMLTMLKHGAGIRALLLDPDVQERFGKLVADSTTEMVLAGDEQDDERIQKLLADVVALLPPIPTAPARPAAAQA